MHEWDFVHGELRSQNILAVGDAVCLLDINWAGTHPSSRHPKEVNTSANWHSGVSSGGIITTFRITSKHCCEQQVKATRHLWSLVTPLIQFIEIIEKRATKSEGSKPLQTLNPSIK